MKRKLLAFLLAAGMIFSLTACSGDTVEEDTSDTPSSQTDTASDEPSEPDSGSLPTDGTFTSNDNSVTGFDMIQVMGKGLSSEDGSFYPMTSFVAGKDSVVAVTFAEEKTIEQDGSMTLTVSKDGGDLIELLPMAGGYTGTSAFFTPKKMEDVGSWAPGTYTFSFTNGESTAQRSVELKEARKIKVLAVPVIANYAGRIVSCEGEWKTAIQFTRDTYPIARDGVEYVLGNEIDLSDAAFDLTTDEGQYNVWAALSSLQTPSNDYELILGFVRERQGADGTTQGYTYGLPANIITESDGDMQPTVAHEIAHCYNIGDEYPGGAINNLINPAPFGMEGSDYNDRESMTAGNKQAVKSANEFGSQNSGSIVLPEQLPMNTNTMSLLENVGSFMGSGSSDIGDYWITSDIWNHLYTAFVDAKEAAPEEEAAAEEEDASDTEEAEETAKLKDEKDAFSLADMRSDKKSGISPTADNQKQADEISLLDITGMLTADGKFTKNPWFSYIGDSSQLSSKKSGDYSVVMTDLAGKELSVQYFTVSFYTQSNPPKKVDRAPVSATVGVPKDTAKISIMVKGKEVYSEAVSKNAPQVEITSIKADGTQLKGKQKVTWSAFDSDGGKLWHELWYCTENGDYSLIDTGITDNSITVDFDKYAGSNAGYLYLYTTDGINTGECNSFEIKVPYKAPEIITEQKTVPTYKLTDEIVFTADVYDMQDGWLYSDDEITWSYKNREYITGCTLWVYPFELAPGKHTFTMTAKNSQGVEAKRDYSFIISDDESALPQDWSKADVKKALSNGFIAPLKTVSASITRGQFAQLMSNLYFTAWVEGSPIPEYEDGIVTDCGEDDYNQFLMVKLGLMEAPGGKFSPNKPITEKEAAIVMYRAVAAADPSWLSDSKDAKLIEDTQKEWGIFEASGDNVFSADKPITGQLALVRCNRIYELMFEG